MTILFNVLLVLGAIPAATFGWPAVVGGASEYKDDPNYGGRFISIGVSLLAMAFLILGVVIVHSRT